MPPRNVTTDRRSGLGSPALVCTLTAHMIVHVLLVHVSATVAKKRWMLCDATQDMSYCPGWPPMCDAAYRSMTPGPAEKGAAGKYHMDLTGGARVEQRLRVVAVSSAQLDALCSALAGLRARLEREVPSIHIQDASAI